jgi:hypothetical protein
VLSLLEESLSKYCDVRGARDLVDGVAMVDGGAMDVLGI